MGIDNKHFYLELGVNTDKNSYQHGENVQITVTLRNKSSMDLQLMIFKFSIDNFLFQ